MKEENRMKKAVIVSGGHQFIVTENEKTLKFEPLMIIDGDKVQVGQPTVKGGVVEAKVLEEAVKGDKVVAIRYKAKKRVNKKRGHRQQHSVIEITKIS